MAKREKAGSPGCPPNTGKPSVAPKSLAGRKDVEELMLYRAKTGTTCNRTEHCFMAIRANDAWWIGERLCTGSIDARREITTADTTLSWVRVKTGAAALVEYTVTVRDRKTKQELEELRWMRLCGVGPSGQPSCTRPALLSCRAEDGSTSVAKFSLKDDGTIVLTSQATPGEACGGHEAFLVGEFDLEFP